MSANEAELINIFGPNYRNYLKFDDKVDLNTGVNPSTLNSGSNIGTGSSILDKNTPLVGSTEYADNLFALGSLGEFNNYGNDVGFGSLRETKTGPYSLDYKEAGIDIKRPGMDLDTDGTQWMGEGGVMDTANATLGTLSSLAKVGLGFQELGLAKDTFNFNKDMKKKEYAMAKDAYDRNKKRAVSVGNQMRSYGGQ
ncbi:MAG: hypothetical protein U9N61_06815 [Euryarchaeota archaeon]|nr:hypothetical protein [Euryarchaeota archaeon]